MINIGENQSSKKLIMVPSEESKHDKDSDSDSSVFSDSEENSNEDRLSLKIKPARMFFNS